MMGTGTTCQPARTRDNVTNGGFAAVQFRASTAGAPVDVGRTVLLYNMVAL